MTPYTGVRRPELDTLYGGPIQLRTPRVVGQRHPLETSRVGQRRRLYEAGRSANVKPAARLDAASAVQPKLDGVARLPWASASRMTADTDSRAASASARHRPVQVLVDLHVEPVRAPLHRARPPPPDGVFRQVVPASPVPFAHAAGPSVAVVTESVIPSRPPGKPQGLCYGTAPVFEGGPRPWRVVMGANMASVTGASILRWLAAQPGPGPPQKCVEP